MKKMYFVAAFILAVTVRLAQAEVYKVPESNATFPVLVADYGGTRYSTNAFTTVHTTAAVGPCVFQNVFFSSGLNTDFVDVWDASTTFNFANRPMFRVYNVANSTAGANSIAMGANGPKFPIRFGAGLLWRASNTSYNSIAVQYWQEQ